VQTAIGLPIALLLGMKKLSQPRKNLSLARETVRKLDNGNLELVAGGWFRATGYASCTSICSDAGSCGCLPA
jgi:hypothetical protein